MKRKRAVVVISALAVSALMTILALANGLNHQVILPMVSAGSSPTQVPTPSPVPTPDFPPGTEIRGLWLTRFNWTGCCRDDTSKIPARIQEIVDNASFAGFNVIYFQVRGEADAFYKSNYEPWSDMLTGQLGLDPGVDPLQLMIDMAHAKNIQVHAYINTYPVWLGCELPAEDTSPKHLYYTLRDYYGATDNKPNGLQWQKDGTIRCDGDYQRASPAANLAGQRMLDVVEDILKRYRVDGIHLDHIRYAAGTSCDPVSREVSGVDCFNGVPENYASYEDWQREQVNGTVKKLYSLVKQYGDHLWLSAAVWHTYIDYWGWGYSEGYNDYYQDSKAWMSGGYIDSISPMLYSGTDKDPNTGNFRQERWYALVENFQRDKGSGFVLPGIGTNHYSSFSEINDRIDMARSLGTAGHIIFSYGGLEQLEYFDDLANGPYAKPAAVPPVVMDP